MLAQITVLNVNILFVGHTVEQNSVVCDDNFCSSTTVLKGASQQENLVYQIIQDAGNKGVRPVFFCIRDAVQNTINLCS